MLGFHLARSVENLSRSETCKPYRMFFVGWGKLLGAGFLESTVFSA
jgi:hypothetical protein